MDKRILVLTDFSKNALNAARYGLALYSDRKCSFYFLNTYQLNAYSFDGPVYNREAGLHSYEIEKRESEKKLEELQQVLRLDFDNPKHTYHTIVTYNSLLEGVNDVIAKNDVDLIIMGTKGMTSPRTVVFGRNTINIMEHVTACPVLAIPEDVGFTPPKEIIFPTDYKKSFKRRELKYLINITQLHDSDIAMLHVKESTKLNKVQQRNKVLLQTIFKNVNHSFHELEDIAVHKGINAFIDSHQGDIVAFVNHKRGFFERLFSTSLISELGQKSRVPVLVLKDRN